MIKYAFYDFEFGMLKIGYTDTDITLLKRVEDINCEKRAFGTI